jgi:hypothetical protein
MQSTYEHTAARRGGAEGQNGLQHVMYDVTATYVHHHLLLPFPLFFYTRFVQMGVKALIEFTSPLCFMPLYLAISPINLLQRLN